jgi:phosphoglycolate phosphatase-like HAD superfamily hydrolase
MGAAFEAVFGERDAFTGVPLQGRTDQQLLADALARTARRLDASALARFRASYSALLSREIREPGPRKGVMPGVRELLETLRSDDQMFVALLTGNFVEAAEIKLRHFGLWDYFPCGAFGDDALERNDLVGIAIARARARGLPPLAATDIVVVGDTPLDVACARAAGALAVAVATGSHDAQALRATGADAVFDDLSDCEAFLDLLRR